MSRIPRIVILGAGYGGVVTAIRLQKELNYNEADVTLVNKHDYHYITTHLHMPAAGTDDPKNARVNILKLIDEFKIDFIKATVQEIRPQEKKVILDEGTLSYDYLVIGLGGEPETFGIPGMLEHAMSIRSINSVNFIREHIEYQFAKYKREPHRKELLNFVVGGAGFTGIEFVGELANRIPELCKEFNVDPAEVNIYNVEAAPTILPGFDAELVDYARQLLEDKGVQFRIGVAIKECTEEGVVLASGEEIPSATVVWTGGIRGNRLIEEAGFETMRGRVKVDEYLRAPGHDDVFIIGDGSIFMNPEGRPYPPTAQIAMQQGAATASNLVASIRNSQLKPFKPSIKGTVASLGRGEAIGVVGKYKMRGFVAAMMKKIIDMRYLYIIGGIPLVLRKTKL
ncbi:NAD(P)/FAD-dependent oxidoreductase [Xylanibacillus composti]|uniref:NADH dehydrogenase n=1 Tax=Xylanibacillus composti TaxID=1572762 RepID=A0A8J4H057_9BACL|nr:NAD(P)/FAD-dependent oxidoreductase [Xylanibacillus composti]MDT9723505.1 NAD(P)/FAD-dependent oxidoreductase [Xylanibacillus composti]GIQ68458.1 NADH dehydrogenase [Xylanibacillus composti]